MKVLINDQVKEIKVASISTLSDVIIQVEKELTPGKIITEISLNNKLLDSNWYHNAKNIYLLDEDTLYLKIEPSSVIARDALVNSKQAFKTILEDFIKISDMFRMEDETKTNQMFAQCIENLQWYLRVLEDATNLLGKNLKDITVNDNKFSSILDELTKKLSDIIDTQENKDWVLLADMIEYEVVPLLENFKLVYEILDV